MTPLLNLICIIMSLFAAIAIACAIVRARPRRSGIGRRCPPTADPYLHPFGERPTVMPDFTREQLEAIARRPVELHHDCDSVGLATRAEQGSGGHGKSFHVVAAAHLSSRSERYAR